METLLFKLRRHSFFSLLERKPAVTADEVEQILDGNLCRCTGYRPIFDAFKTFAVGDNRLPVDDDRLPVDDIEDLADGGDKKCCKKLGGKCAKNSESKSGQPTSYNRAVRVH